MIYTGVINNSTVHNGTYIYNAKYQNTFVMLKISVYASSDPMIVNGISLEKSLSPNFETGTSLWRIQDLLKGLKTRVQKLPDFARGWGFLNIFLSYSSYN